MNSNTRMIIFNHIEPGVQSDAKAAHPPISDIIVSTSFSLSHLHFLSTPNHNDKLVQILSHGEQDVFVELPH